MSAAAEGPVSALEVVALPGDGVGPEVVDAALEVLDAVCRRWGHRLRVEMRPVGWAALREAGDALPPATLDACRSARAVLLGAVGDPAAEGLEPERRPEAGLLRLRKALGCYANLRPVRILDGLLHASPLRPEVARGTDLLVVRELTGGLYYGEPRGVSAAATGGARAVDTMAYDEHEVRRIATRAFQLARGRRRRVDSVDKANVLACSVLWRGVVDEVAADFGDVELRHVLVDTAALRLVTCPGEFDVILTENLFGDVLSDEAAGLAGSLGLAASASLGGATDLYEPVHGSAPDLAGLDRANPVGAILSVALMLRHTFGLEAEARGVEGAVEAALDAGARTRDVALAGASAVGTREMARAVVAALPEDPRRPAGDSGRSERAATEVRP